MQCPQCGTSLSETARFCSNCGRRLTAKTEGNTKVKRIASERRPATSATLSSLPTSLTSVAQDTSPKVEDESEEVFGAETREWSLPTEVIPIASADGIIPEGTFIAHRYVIQKFTGISNNQPIYIVEDTQAASACWECDAPVPLNERFCQVCGAEQQPTLMAIQLLATPPTDTSDSIVDNTPQGERYFCIISQPVMLDPIEPEAALSSIRTMEIPVAHIDTENHNSTGIDLESTVTLDMFAMTDPHDDAGIEVTTEILRRISGIGLGDPSATIAPEIWEQNEAPTVEVDFVEQLGQSRRSSEVTDDYPRLVTGIASHVGQARVGRPNEDSALVTTLTIGGDSVPPPLTLCVIADGLGGHNDGQRAGRIAVRVIARYIINHLWLPTVADSTTLPAEPEALGVILAEAVQEANAMILILNQEEGGDMGCTVTALLAQGTSACVANIGDSRTYRLTADGLRRVTTDHSLVARLVKSRLIEPDEVYTHPQRSQIYRSLGDESHVEVDVFPSRLEIGERFLLCSDGLWEMVRDPDIGMILGAEATPQQLADHLINVANANGGDDNVTVITVEVVQP